MARLRILKVDKTRQKSYLYWNKVAGIELKKELHMTPRNRFKYWQEKPVFNRWMNR